MISSILFEVITLFSHSKVIPKSIRTQLLQLLYIMAFSTVLPSFPGTGFGCLCSWAALMWHSCDLSSALGKELWETGLRWALPGPPPPRLGAAPCLRPQPWSPPEPRCCCPGPLLAQVRRLSIPAGLITVELLGTWILCWPLLQSWPLPCSPCMCAVGHSPAGGSTAHLVSPLVPWSWCWPSCWPCLCPDSVEVVRCPSKTLP